MYAELLASGVGGGAAASARGVVQAQTAANPVNNTPLRDLDSTGETTAASRLHSAARATMRED